MDYQVKAALATLEPKQVKRCVIAYEPIWAIGTGKTATAEQAAEVCGFIRSVIRGMYDARVARAVSILYGGSMNAKNCDELLAIRISISTADSSAAPPSRRTTLPA